MREGVRGCVRACVDSACVNTETENGAIEARENMRPTDI